jgi:hypothetical protein
MSQTSKRNPNPFVRMAQEAKEKQKLAKSMDIMKPELNTKAPKSTKGFGNKIIKKTGRA